LTTATDTAGYNIVLNSYNPTIASMYTVYLGLQNKTDLSTATSKILSDVIVVR
jgi:hypothetical protein